jgi:UDP-2,3-diacylglucosamine pyrophosphatase LpxH
MGYRERIAAALTRAYARAERTSLDLRTAKCIVFSDHHKGVRDGADDFRGVERAYRAALGHYLEAGYTLYVLGDVEELWECHAKGVIASYPEPLHLEAMFQGQGRYVRFFGNHDDQWESPRSVRKYLRPVLGEISVLEGLRLTVQDAGQPVGELFLVHGHQGTSGSDRFRWIAKPVVRYIWRPLQRLTGARLNTPARSFELRAQHDRAMYAWAAGEGGLILIAGHTHKPVFLAEPRVPILTRELEALRSSGAPAEEIARVRAELEWHRSLEETAGEIPARPCYFNTGCCSFDDGDCTGIEIADGLIRLVRWPDDQGAPRRKILREASFQKVLQACQT